MKKPIFFLKKLTSIFGKKTMNIIHFIKIEKIEKTLFIFSFIVNSLFLLTYRHYLWDLNVYKLAVNTFNNGASPYLHLEGLRFVYSPYVLYALSYCGAALTFTLIGLSFVSFILLLKQEFGRKIIFYSIVSSLVFFNDFLFKSVATGNITAFLHFTVIAAACFSQNRKINIFLFVVCISSIVKPYFLAYLILGAIMRSNFRQYCLQACLTVGIFVVIFSSQIILFPSLFNEFLTSLSAQALGNMEGPGRDVGLAPYAMFGGVVDRTYAIGLHFVVVLLGGYLLLCLGKNAAKNLNSKDTTKLFFFLCLIIITFLNPRMKVYDYWVEVAASTGIVFTLLRKLELTQQIKWKKILLIGALITMLFAVTKDKHAFILQVYLPPFFAIGACFHFIQLQHTIKPE